MLSLTFQTTLVANQENNNYTQICFPEEQVAIWKAAGVKRVNGTINDIPFRLAFQNHGKRGFYLLINKDICKRGKLHVGNQVNVTISQDLNPDYIEFAEELVEVLAQDDEASKKFFALTVGKQRTLNYYVEGVKNVETRIKRSFEIADQVKRNAVTIGIKKSES